MRISKRGEKFEPNRNENSVTRLRRKKGMKLVRRRRMLLSHPLTEKQATALIAALREMMGVVNVKYIEEEMPPEPTSQQTQDESQTPAGVGGFEITHDLLEAPVAQLERRIAEVGGRFGDGLGEKLRRDFVRYIEECELQDIETATRLLTGESAVRIRR